MTPTTTEKSIRYAHDFAFHAHSRTNHFYNNKPYIYHLEMVAEWVRWFSKLLTTDEFEIAIRACYLHDTIEDCRLTYNDIKSEFGEEVAEVVYLLTNNKGRTRKERAGADYYAAIAENKVARFVKICDRLANAEHSKETKSKMLDVYSKENEDFKSYLQSKGDSFDIMFEQLDSILNTNQ